MASRRLFSSATPGALAGRIAVVTGAGSGIGRAVCNILAKEHANIVAADINSEFAKATVANLVHGDGSSHLSFGLDVSKKDGVEKVFSELLDYYKKPATILVNCAGITRDGQLKEMTEEQFDEVVNVNLKGTYLPSQVACKYMVQYKVAEGSIVNVSSISGKTGNFGQANYSATKAAVIGLTKTVAKEMAKHNIRCNAVLPGFIDTPMVASVPEKILMIMTMLIPMARQGKPEEVADAIAYLASPRSSYVTGATLEVTGGLFM
jgi:17beta-estradiol 17-dehydrogenase/3alpha(17beta)-hydroxysteroid dehydrogenase (NAD+)